MLLSGNGREAVRQACLEVQARLQFPLAPSIIVLSGGKAEGRERLGPCELRVPPFTGEKTRQDPMIRLADQNELIALLLNDHGAALARSVRTRTRLQTTTRCSSAGRVAELDPIYDIMHFGREAMQRVSEAVREVDWRKRRP